MDFLGFLFRRDNRKLLLLNPKNFTEEPPLSERSSSLRTLRGALTESF